MRTWTLFAVVLAFFVCVRTTSAQPKEVIFYQDVSWSPDASKLLLSRMDIIGDSYHKSIYVINVDGSGYTKLTNVPSMWTSWSPDGSKIAYFAKPDDNGDIYVMDADGSKSVRLTTHPAQDTHPDWSQDGSKILFVSYRDSISQIYVMDHDGTNQTRITNTPGNKWNPRWSPDGREVVFYGAQELGEDSLYVMNSNGSDIVTLGPGIWPSWSPDGSKILYRAVTKGIHEMKSDGTGRTKLINDGAGFARWSLDGTKLAFLRETWVAPDGWPASNDLFLINADGSGETKLTEP